MISGANNPIQGMEADQIFCRNVNHSIIDITNGTSEHMWDKHSFMMKQFILATQKVAT